MLFKEALEITKRLTPSLYKDEELSRWLMMCERQIWEEIILTHTGWCCRSKPTGEADSELIVPDRFAEDIYVNFLQARIAKENQETMKYNAAITLYNDGYTRFAKWYNERHKPLPCGLSWKV